MKKSPPSIIPLNYDYQKMSPSSNVNQAARGDATSTFYDNQYQSLFGDPVPPSPSEDYLGHLDGSLYGSFRRDSYASAVTDDFNRTVTLTTESGRRPSRLFSPTPIASTSTHLSPLLAPDIQILPDSGSGHSSSDPQSPNYALLRPDAAKRPSVDETYMPEEEEPQTGEQDYEQDYEQYEQTAMEVTRRISDFSEDFKSNVGSLRESPPEVPQPPTRYNRQISNESYSSIEWFKPINAYPEFTKMPKLRPSSKNVLSIKHREMPPEDSPVAAMINDSNGSSSSEDQQKIDALPIRPPEPQPSRLRSLQQQSSSTETMLPTMLPLPPPLPPPPAPLTLPPPDPAPPPPAVRQKSPIILTEAITTGADHRISAPRSHKKSSFTILAERSPQSSQATSPHKVSTPGRLSPFLGHGFKEPDKLTRAEPSSQSPRKPIARPRMLQQKSLSTTQLKLPSISGPTNQVTTTDDSQRPSVQFNMSGRRGPINMQMTHQKGILHTGKDPSSSSQEMPLPLTQSSKIKSYEALPLITDPYRTAIPRLSAPSRPVMSNVNPTRKQRGLLRVINSADSLSRIPVRSNWASMDDLATQRKPLLSPIKVKARRRSSSTSPERRSSTQTEPRSSIVSDRRSSNLSTVTTSDFSFRRPSLSPRRSPLVVRRKSIYQPRRTSQSSPTSPSNRLRVSKTPRKVAKPTTLSPILGTPNKDLSQSSPSDSQGLPRRESLSKIPIRNSPNATSRSNSRMSSRANSRINSRSNSPMKANSRAPSSRSPSRQTSRPESRITSRGGSRPTSRAESNKPTSRSTSRASTGQASRAVSRASSRADSRPNSRMEQARTVANSRSNSRLSTRSESPIKSRKSSPLIVRQRSKSSSRSPVPRRTRRKSINPSKVTKPSRTPIMQRRSSKSQIPARIPTSKSSPTSKTSSKTGLRRESSKRASGRKQASAKKPAPTSTTRSDPKTDEKKVPTPGAARRTPSSVRKSASKQATPATGAIKSRQPSNVQSKTPRKTPTEFKRESSSVQPQVKKEGSAVSLKKNDTQAQSNQSEAPTHANANEDSEGSTEPSKKLKRPPSALTLLSVGSKLSLLRKRSDSNLSKKLEEMKNGADATTDAGASNGKLVALTKANVVSMTTAAITAQPVEISTVLANQLPKTSSSGQLLAGQEDLALPAAILEKSQKTLENIQKTVIEAADEIQKTINENLTDLKSLESDMGKLSEDMTGSPLPFEKSESLTTIIEKRPPTNGGGSKAAKPGTTTIDDAFGERVEKPPTPQHPIEPSVMVANQLPGNGHNTHQGHDGATGSHLVADEDTAERSTDAGLSDEMRVVGAHEAASKVGASSTMEDASKPGANSGDGNASLEAGSDDPLNGDKDHTKGCCKCSNCCKCPSCFCIPCRRSRCSKCCRKKGQDPEAAALASVEVIDEKVSCWKKMKCCKRKPKPTQSESMEERKMESISEEPERRFSHASMPPNQSKCGLCLSKVFCCRSVNKIEAASGDMEEVKKCCFCIPCRKKKAGTSTQSAWHDPDRPQESTITQAPPPGPAPLPPKEGCCSKFCQKLNCCKRKKQSLSESRRSSMKQANVPPPEDNRRKLHVDLVEYNSKMKGAIPVMPLYLAWFCAICNTIIPGLGTLFSGFFCICVGIPRFSQFDSARARVGSLIINCIVAVAQLFCVLFCFVGWGWSIWWGTIMLKTARKLNKIRKVEKLEMEEERRQAQMAAASAHAPATDVEAGKT